MIRNKRLMLPVLLLVMLAGHKSALAASPDGITVSPAFQLVSIQKDAAQQPVTFKITNNEQVAQDLKLSVADFNTLNESGGLFFVGTNPTQIQKKYGLAKWLSLPQTEITVNAKQTVTIDASVLNQSDLSAGGHYGALMISIGGQNDKTGKVGINPVASSLLFVTKPQGATYSLALTNVIFKHGLFKLPDDITLDFHNSGNTHVVPRGTVSLINPKGHVIAKGIINENSKIILPETNRKYNVALSKLAAADEFGNYKVQIAFRFDGMDLYRSYTKSFRYSPGGTLIKVMLILLVIGVIAYSVSSVVQNYRSWS